MARVFGSVLWMGSSRSASRPPQPLLKGWSGMEDCHWRCWSEWEKSCGGFCEAGRLLKLARVTFGWVSTPTLEMKPNSPASNRVLR